MFGLLLPEQEYLEDEYPQMIYKGLLLDDRQPYLFRDEEVYEPYTEDFMISPEELEMRRLRMQMLRDSTVSREIMQNPLSSRTPMGFYDGRNYYNPQEYYFNPNEIYGYQKGKIMAYGKGKKGKKSQDRTKTGKYC